jgi:hypothetical protein
MRLKRFSVNVMDTDTIHSFFAVQSYNEQS